jgi:hypothetical protein
MTDETTNRLVIVRREALEGVAQPPDGSVERVLQFLDTFASVATNKPEHGRAGAEARRPRRIPGSNQCIAGPSTTKRHLKQRLPCALEVIAESSSARRSVSTCLPEFYVPLDCSYICVARLYLFSKHSSWGMNTLNPFPSSTGLMADRRWR